MASPYDLLICIFLVFSYVPDLGCELLLTHVRSSSSASAMSASKSCRDAVGAVAGAIFTAGFFFPIVAEIQGKQCYCLKWTVGSGQNDR